MWVLKESERDRLKNPHGKIFNTDEAVNYLRSVQGRIIIVGDYSAYTLTRADAKLTPFLILYDLKTLRKPIDSVLRVYLSSLCKSYSTMEVSNPPGHISSEADFVISSLLNGSEPACVHVDGEEDLLALSCVMYAQEGDVVVYGQPKKGVVIVEINDSSKDHAKTLLKECFERIPSPFEPKPEDLDDASG